MSEEKPTEEKPVALHKKDSERSFSTYEEARVVFDQAVKAGKHSKVRLRRRHDGFGVVTYSRVRVGA